MRHPLCVPPNLELFRNVHRRAGKWASFVHPGLHTLGIASTQRCESTNSAVKKLVSRNGSMAELDAAIFAKVQDGTNRTQRWELMRPFSFTARGNRPVCVLRACVLANCAEGRRLHPAETKTIVVLLIFEARVSEVFCPYGVT